MDKLLTEFTACEYASYEDGTLYGLKLLGRISKNGREYTEQAIANAAGKYNGTKVYIDHKLDKNGKELPRSYSERIGSIVNARQGDNGDLYGDFKINAGHPMAEAVLFDIKNNTPGVGFSHMAYCSETTKEGKVEAIGRVISVDIVDDPATTTSFHESVVVDSPAEVTYSFPEFWKENTVLKDEVVVLKTKVEQLQLKLDELTTVKEVKAKVKPIAQLPQPIEAKKSNNYADWVRKLRFNH